MPCRELAAEQYSVQIDVYHAMEFGEVNVDESAERRSDSRVIEHDVQTAEVGNGEVDHILDIFRVRHVRLLECHGFSHLVGNGLAAFRVDVCNDYLGPFFDEAIDGTSTDAAGAPGDDCDFSN